MIPFTSTNSRCAGHFLYNDRRRLIISDAKAPASMILSVPLRTCVRSGGSALKPSQRCLGIIGCGREGLCEFVRDGGDQFSHHAHPMDMCQIGLELSQSLALLFCPLAILNVREGSVPFNNVSMLIPKWYTTHQKTTDIPRQRRDGIAPRLRKPVRLQQRCATSRNGAQDPRDGSHAANPRLRSPRLRARCIQSSAYLQMC